MSASDIEITNRDIQFECKACENILVVDRAGEGLELPCPHCEALVTVPKYEEAKAAVAKPVASRAEPAIDTKPKAIPSESEGKREEPVPEPSQKKEEKPPASPPEFDFSALSNEELREKQEKVTRQLKENASQRTEFQGYINQETIQLHRRKLHLEKLQKKNITLTAEAKALAEAMSKNLQDQ